MKEYEMEDHTSDLKEEIDELVLELPTAHDVIDNLKVSHKAAVLHDMVISGDDNDEGTWIIEVENLSRKINEVLLNGITTPDPDPCYKELFWLLADSLLIYKEEAITKRCADFVEYMNPASPITDEYDFHGVKESDFC